MTRLQVCVAVVAVLLHRGALAQREQRETMQDGGFLGDERERGGLLAAADDMGSGGLTVQDPPAGWPLSELRAFEHRDDQHGGHPQARAGRWEASADTSPWTAVEETEPEAAASEPRGAVRWFSATPAPAGAAAVAVAAPEDQESMPAEPGQWYAEAPFAGFPHAMPLRQGRVLAASPDPNMAVPQPAAMLASPEHSVNFFEAPQDAEAAAGNDAPMGQPWQPTNSRYKRKRKQNMAVQQQELEQAMLQQHQQHQQHQQQQQEEPQLQHEAPPLEVKKTKKPVKRVNKRRPAPAHTYAPQPQPVIISNGAPGPQGPQGLQGPDPTVSVGYSIGFAASDAGAVVGGGVAAPPQLQPVAGQDYPQHRGTVQNDVVQGEVVHGEGAVSYSNTLLGNKAVPHQPSQGVVNVVSSQAINGRPIYVPPLQQSPLSAPSGPSGPPAAYQPLALPLPTPQALIGSPAPSSPSPSYSLSVVTAAPPAGPTGPVVVSTTPSYVVRTPHTIFSSGSTTKSEFALGPPSLQQLHRKPPKAASAVLHINDGTDFAWQDVGNGVEVSAPITPNGLRGGYRDSIPIMEATDDDSEPPAVPFEASTAAGLHAAAPVGSTVSPFGHDFSLSHGGHPAQFEHGNALYGGAESGRVEVPSNHLPEDPPGLSAGPAGPHSKPDPFRGFTSSSFADFMRAYSSSGRQPHSAGGPGPAFAPPSFEGPSADPLLGSKLVQGQVYYLASETPGGQPIPAVIMPLSRLRELHAALPSAKKPVYNLPPEASPSPAPDAPFKSPSFSEFPFKSFPDSAFKSSVFSESPFKSEQAPFKTSSSLSEAPFPSLQDSPFKSPASSFGGDHRGPPPSKYRPSPYKSKEAFFKQSGGFPRPHPHHLGGYSSKPHGLRFGPSPSPSGPTPTGSSVKITKSVPVYEEHQTLSKHPHQPQHQGSSPSLVTAEDPSAGPQWPPKESLDVQTYYMPIEQFDGLKSNALPPSPSGPSGLRPGFGHGHPRGPPQLHREVRRPPPHRPVRAHQAHQPHLPSPAPSAAAGLHHHGLHHHGGHGGHGQLEPGAFAVSSSYRVRPSG